MIKTSEPDNNQLKIGRHDTREKDVPAKQIWIVMSCTIMGTKALGRSVSDWVDVSIEWSNGQMQEAQQEKAQHVELA